MPHPNSALGTVTLTIDGKEVTVPAGTTIFDAARMNGIHIPVLCHQQNETPVGVCRMCVVDVNQRTYAAACIRNADPGMVVRTHSQPVREARKTFVIARQGKGYDAGIAFDMDDPMGSSSCVSCGECMVSCPTGALTNKKVVGQQIGEGFSVETQELLELPVFKGVSGTFLELNRGSVVKRVINKGDILFREGDYGSTAFYILEGQVDIFIASPRAHVNTNDEAHGLFHVLRSKLVGRKQDRRPEESMNKTFISIDAPVELAYDRPVAQLGPGDLFGEMTCMSFYPRSATARAATRIVVLEMLRNVLDVLQKNKTFRAKLDTEYRQSALETHLRSVPIFASM